MKGHTTTPSLRAERGAGGVRAGDGGLLVPEGALLEFRDIAFVGGEAVERRRPVHVAIFHAERAVGVEDDGAFVDRGPRDEPAHGVVARAETGGPARETRDRPRTPDAVRHVQPMSTTARWAPALGVRRRPGLRRGATAATIFFVSRFPARMPGL